MPGKFTLCIALLGVFTRREGSQKPEYNAPRLDFLPSNQSGPIGCQGEPLRHFTIDLPPKWFEQDPTCDLGTVEASLCKSGLVAELLLRIQHELRQMEEASLRDLDRRLLDVRSVDTSVRRLPLWLEQARKLLQTQFAEQPTLSMIADDVGVHPVHLARQFRKHYGSSVGEYLRSLRIEFACEQLLASDEPLVKIATAAGFADQSHFSRTFRRLRGTTPGKYRTALKSVGNSVRRPSEMGDCASCSF